MKKNKPSHHKSNPAAKRNSAATHTFKRVYGKPKVVNHSEVKRVKVNRTRHVYSAEGTKCKSVNDCSGILKPTQWNRLVCNKCNYSELI